MAFIFIVLIVRFVSGGWEPSLDEAPNSLRLTGTQSNAAIINGSGDEKSVSGNTALSALDLIEVRSGTGQVAFLGNEKNLLNLNTGTKLRFTGVEQDGKSGFRLENKDLWIQADTAAMNIDLVGTIISPASLTVANVSKNELFTTITVLQGSVTLNLSGSLLEIPAGKQLNYSTLKALTIEELTSRITDINTESLSSDWMTTNGAGAYVANTTNPSGTTTGSTSTTPTTGSLILFESPLDESSTDAKSVSVKGRILSPTVSRIVVNGTPATVDPATQTFSIASLALTAKENNLVYRTYDVGWALLSKGVITVHTTASDLAWQSTNNTSSVAQSVTYPTDNRFRVTSPSSDFYETRETKVRLEWQVTAGAAHHIRINGFRLTSFAANGTSWYYFANQQFGNLQDGMNTYTIQYFDAQGNEVYKQLFVIKKLPPYTSTGTTTTPTTSTQETNI